ncbi:putative Rieske iron-sulphur domain protein [Halobacteriovorax marinus SJ]|uniref:Rieske iron-sulphur domain protein n=1 Tax=Halobacteriovorax marinus (strain ATCC BAA-682 / DSM 15412 / SJ) TaxID=862908 RepID=E1X1X2_HALMS|nr:aromatic ring-hydroxylating dioxygenase subunit alpha [Halobacteriovorax marinus]CBW26632.1 putative Rieske iron-sulphur domain protein [Halobacteriovorax marinus SJ]
MSNLSKTKIFNNTHAIIEGWYWGLRSKELKKGKIKHLKLMGEDLAVYRGEDGIVRALKAHCPHMGAHLAEGKVEGNEVRCFFHHWKFDSEGNLNDIPCREKLGLKVKQATYPVEERYGLIWIWTGEQAKRKLPFVPELEDQEVDSTLGTPFVKECHPNVMMINAIDAHHFYSVHNLPVKLFLRPRVINSNTIQFNNETKVPDTNIFTRFIGRFYAGALTYSMCYFNASTGTVTIGPDFLHFHIMFAIRSNEQGKAEGQTVLITKKRKGLIGKLVNKVLLAATKVVGNYFAAGDTEVFKTIKFDFKHPLNEDHAIIKFIQHAEKQQTCDWGYAKKIDNDVEDMIDLHNGPLVASKKVNSSKEVMEMSHEG